ncbi:MAG TPA: lipid IV(A) 3-deoxy-D-manno-octulosonic acid transferase [Gammaproteobacteria bacterium]|nr:lipid IV(A) 3-deoxy-D-manno-octulosonic acid transferase [Gammaproteobacteria bacterium]
MSRTLYTLLAALLMPAAFVHLEWRARRQTGAGDAWRERCGRFPDPHIARGAIWVHAASVGEVTAARPLVSRLRGAHPGQPLLVTTFTAAGRVRAADMFRGVAAVGTLPYDLPPFVRRFLRDLAPRCLVAVETEIWPNLYAAARLAGVPVVLASARLSERAMARYQRQRTLVREALEGVAAVLAQSSVDADRFVALGAVPERVTVAGNLKFDVEPPPGTEERGRELKRHVFANRPVFLAASTRDGEELPVLDAFTRLRRRVPAAVLVLAPRHPERAAAVAALAASRGYAVVRRSAGTAFNQTLDVYVVDTLGELMAFYAAADVAFVGGSLVPVGGHNLLEPVALGVPTLTGPHVFNAPEIAAVLQEAGAVRIVADGTGLAEEAEKLLGDAASRAAMAEQARAVLAAHRGAAGRIAAALMSVLGGRA